MEIDLTGNDDSATHASTGFDDAEDYTAERETRTSAYRHSFPTGLLPLHRAGGPATPPGSFQTPAWPTLSTDAVHESIPSMQRLHPLRGQGPSSDLRHFEYIPGSPAACSETSSSPSPRRSALHHVTLPPLATSPSLYERKVSRYRASPGWRSHDASPITYHGWQPGMHPDRASPAISGQDRAPPSTGSQLSLLPSISELNLPLAGDYLQQRLAVAGPSSLRSPENSRAPPSPTSDVSVSGSRSPSDERRRHQAREDESLLRGRRGPGPQRTLKRSRQHQTPVQRSSSSSRASSIPAPPRPAVPRTGSPYGVIDYAASQDALPARTFSRAAWSIPGQQDQEEEDGEQLRGRAAHHINEFRPFTCQYTDPLNGRVCKGGRTKKIYDLLRHVIIVHIKREIEEVAAGRLSHDPDALARSLGLPLIDMSGAPSVPPPPPAHAAAPSSLATATALLAGAGNSAPPATAPMLKAVAGSIALHVDWPYLESIGVKQPTETTHFIFKTLIEVCILLTCRFCDNSGQTRKPFSRRDVLKKHLKDQHDKTLQENDAQGPHPAAEETFHSRYNIIFGNIRPHVSVQTGVPRGISNLPQLVVYEQQEAEARAARAAASPQLSPVAHNGGGMSSPAPSPYPAPPHQSQSQAQPPPPPNFGAGPSRQPTSPTGHSYVNEYAESSARPPQDRRYANWTNTTASHIPPRMPVTVSQYRASVPEFPVGVMKSVLSKTFASGPRTSHKPLPAPCLVGGGARALYGRRRSDSSVHAPLFSRGGLCMAQAHPASPASMGMFTQPQSLLSSPALSSPSVGSASPMDHYYAASPSTLSSAPNSGISSLSDLPYVFDNFGLASPAVKHPPRGMCLGGILESGVLENTLQLGGVSASGKLVRLEQPDGAETVAASGFWDGFGDMYDDFYGPQISPDGMSQCSIVQGTHDLPPGFATPFGFSVRPTPILPPPTMSDVPSTPTNVTYPIVPQIMIHSAPDDPPRRHHVSHSAPQPAPSQFFGQLDDPNPDDPMCDTFLGHYTAIPE